MRRLESSRVLADIIKNNGDADYDIEMKKYCYQKRQRLLNEGIPYNYYLLIQTTFENGCDCRYAFVKLFEDIDFSYMQKLYLIELLDEVRSVNKKSRENYGVAGERAFLLNCDEDGRMARVNNTAKFRPVLSWIKERVLGEEGILDKYGNLKKCFYSEDFHRIEKRPIFPIMKLGERMVTGERGLMVQRLQLLWVFQLN